ncbi:hypothetical protein JG687_00013960 [Phytophthora cactorum]|uniref:Uncharacterized protein n=1 Tax=Phytophthora cactorum TaxID=29920 RepID=A0A8T1U242_9STRA|nr:hypothetical protein PC120_g19333 [Phytophthora cactorum]KAG3048764.1 hypothetical protein PC121_g19298 [Phytophthora cactorum]KAG4044791.1 hypothetical protein PC123_g19784 [Phytophthora cactorum]KAG6950902.1 hypothetical protein JG687_00013960 [Phytophthora cactorum]
MEELLPVPEAGSDHEPDGEEADGDSNDNDEDSDWTPASGDLSGDELLDSKKIQTMYNKVRRYVPEEFVNDPTYDAPKDEGERKAEEMQKARAIKRKEAAKKKKLERVAAPVLHEEM